MNGHSISGAVLAVQHHQDTEVFSAGDFEKEEPYFIASTTKLYTTASIFILRKEGLINLDDTLSKWFDKNFIKGLHVYKGVDYTESITIKHLLTHTSGLPDYFQQAKGKWKEFGRRTSRGYRSVLVF